MSVLLKRFFKEMYSSTKCICHDNDFIGTCKGIMTMHLCGKILLFPYMGCSIIINTLMQDIT